VEAIEAIDTVHDPSPDNLWTCATCGADATREDYEE